MKLLRYIKEKCAVLVSFFIVVIFAISLADLFEVNFHYVVIILFLMFLLGISLFIGDFLKRSRYYNGILKTVDELDQKYLIHELGEKGTFFEAEFMHEILYQIGKSMTDKVNACEQTEEEFKEYLETWVHDIKIPIAALSLMNYNKSNDFEKQKTVIDQLEYYVEQVLFLARADVTEKDCLLKKCTVESIINKVIIGQKELLIGNKIKIEKINTDVYIDTDSKWMEYIINQIVNNCIKYMDDKTDRGIVFEVKEYGDKSELRITDNGIGISSDDISRVFDKSFTGKNGRKGKNSTGMGLYICKKLCNKMGHNIFIESEEGIGTTVNIVFGDNQYYREVV